ncbi:MAG: hypothetical protein GX588_01065 [Clostridiaceae bacterium]|nr:hypothetical protein [Clostridiaceae bacterium]
MKNLCGRLNPDISAREKENAALARDAAREGIVLLKSEGALPLQANRVALFGMGAQSLSGA